MAGDLNYIDPSGHDPWWLQEPWRQTTDQYDEAGASFGEAHIAAEQARVGSYYGRTPSLQTIAHSQPTPTSPQVRGEARKMAIATVCDVCDVVLTLNRWRQGDFSGWDLVGMAAPIISAKAARHLGSGFRGPKAKGFDWDHILDRHAEWGQIAQQRTTGDVFEGLTEQQIQARVTSAWKNRKLLQTQEDPSGTIRMRYQGVDPQSKQNIEFWFNAETRIVETAYPKN